jgi:hypothetical protein
MANDTTNPLDEVSAISLDDLFSSRPPFDAQAMRAMVAEFRRMRVKWQAEDAAGTTKRGARKAKAATQPVAIDIDLFEEG